jgi:dimethylglycine dehydrogenase
LYSQGGFIGRDAVLAARPSDEGRRLRLLAIASSDPDPAGGESVTYNGQSIAALNSAAFSYTFDHALGLAYLPGVLDSRTEGLEIEILGIRSPARILETAPYDPTGARMRDPR